jgi:threonine aldolase
MQQREYALIDLRSDTLTTPSPAMREAMLHAAVGDDVYAEDPTVIALQEYAAALLEKEAALYAPSGTQSNLLALFAHCDRGDEYIVGDSAHTFRYEGGGAAILGSIPPQPIPMAMDGTLGLDTIEAAINPDDFHFARSRLICLENTHAGEPLPLGYAEAVAGLAQRRGLAMHLDGARLFNAALAQNRTPAALAAPFDSVSICLSKGLGAPVGSLLVGSVALIDEARRWRKVLGGGMRQAGVIAAAGLHALQYQRDDLAQDHIHAAELAACVADNFGDGAVRYATNMVHLTLPDETYGALAAHLSELGARVGRPRWVLHRDISADDLATLCRGIQGFSID